MRVLVLHSRYLSGSLSGENRVVEEETELLRAAGHHVTTLSPSADDFSPSALAARSLASTGVAHAVRERVAVEKIDVVHAHNLYPTLGPRVLKAAKAAGAAVVMTLHNYRLMCIAGTFFREGRICEDCLGGTPLPGVLHACYRHSRAQSAVLATSLASARMTAVFAAVDCYLAVSQFVRDKHVVAGLPAEKIVVKPNVVPAQVRRDGPGTYFLVLSRLSVEKGVSEIVRAWDPRLGELRIVGDGPEARELARLAGGRGIRIEPGVAPHEVPALLVGARAVIVPSACFEGQPRVVLEAYSSGVPVLASRIGGLSEVVLDGETGVTIERGDLAGWRAAVARLADDGESIRLGEAAHELWRERFSPERGLAQLEDVYERAVDARAALPIVA
jgi:glycosyltransferase involved in cell wall biosynthesis